MTPGLLRDDRGMGRAGRKPLVIADYDASWPDRFSAIGSSLRGALGDAVLRIDHIGSTAVAGLPAKDVIDVQVTVLDLVGADAWAEELLPGLVRRQEVTADHVPPGATADSREWTKRYWSDRWTLHVHVREQGRLNQRYPLLFRDYLRADSVAAEAYAQVKRALAVAAPDDWDTYYAVKDPVCDVIIAAAEHWAVRVGWTPSDSDA